MRDRLLSEPVEVFHVLALDARGKPIGWSEVARGGLVACAVEPAAILRFLVLTGATRAIVLHNHPSGDPKPSADDITFTARLRTAFDACGIRLADHVIVASEGYFSFMDAGLLPCG
jgi:DNA repair protein RadC